MNQDEEKRISPEREKLEKEVATHPFFIGIGDRHIRLLADCAMPSHFHAGGIIFREGESANFFYGTILREYCEKDHSLGFELFKRMSVVMLRRLQAARQKLMSARRTGNR